MAWLVLFLLTGVPALFFMLLFTTSLLEKHPLKQFVPVDWERLPDRSPYFLAMNESARQLGFELVGALGQPHRSGLYKAYAGIWLSPDKRTVARIAGGKTAGVREKRTILTSYLTDNRIIESTDIFGTRDLSGLTDRKVLLHADFAELHAFHQQRLAEQPLPSRTFEKERVFGVLESLAAMRVTRLKELGLARYTNPEQTIWSYSLKGAWQMCTNLQREKGAALLQIERSKLKRPGDSRPV